MRRSYWVLNKEIKNIPEISKKNFISYKRGQYQLVPKKYTIDRKIAVRSYLDQNRTELSSRTFCPQKHWFSIPVRQNSLLLTPHASRREAYEGFHKKLIWEAFDVPERISLLLRDQSIHGRKGMYDASTLEAAKYWVMEARYWRCIGISLPFYDSHTLRVRCMERPSFWETLAYDASSTDAQNPNSTPHYPMDTFVMSRAMKHAIIDLERAHRRDELGLSPDYIWDRWGPIGFIDNKRADYLPRFVHNPYIDPDGVEVTEEDISSLSSHTQIRERYSKFINPDTQAFSGLFLSPSHGGGGGGGQLELKDLNDDVLVERVMEWRMGEIKKDESRYTQIFSPQEFRWLVMISSNPNIRNHILQEATQWSDIKSLLQSHFSSKSLDLLVQKVDAARLISNTQSSIDMVRRFYEEKCGFHDFMYTPDKQITGAVLSFLEDLRYLCCETNYGTPFALAMTDIERANALGEEEFSIFRHLEDMILDRQRQIWNSRFTTQNIHEKMNDDKENLVGQMLDKFEQRNDSLRHTGAFGAEYDRETEPIGRQVQRRVLESDKLKKLAEARRNKGKLMKKRRSSLDELHAKQLQNVNYGIH